MASLSVDPLTENGVNTADWMFTAWLNTRRMKSYWPWLSMVCVLLLPFSWESVQVRIEDDLSMTTEQRWGGGGRFRESQGGLAFVEPLERRMEFWGGRL